MQARGTSKAIQDNVLVVIVNFRVGPLVVDCLRSLKPEVAALPGTRVVVVDNCSNDGSVELIASAIESEGWSDWAELQQCEVNGGFSWGNNHAVRPVIRSEHPPAYFWLVNPDTQIRAGALRALVDFMNGHPRVGIAGSSLETSNGTLWPFAFRFPSIWSELENGLRLGVVSALLKSRVVARRMSDQPAQVDWLPGASMMIRREVFDVVGLMDEDYFLYFEETDFCLQARKAGWQCWYVPQSRVMHLAGQSTGVTGKRTVARRLPKYWFDSRRRYFTKNHGRLYAALTDLVWAISFLVWRVRRRVQGKSDPDPPHLLADFLENSAIVNAGIPCNPVAVASSRELSRFEAR
ncbi:MAG: glycosyltransferase family 2 protein [Burkholderiaceae bacterium]